MLAGAISCIVFLANSTFSLITVLLLRDLSSFEDERAFRFAFLWLMRDLFLIVTAAGRRIFSNEGFGRYFSTMLPD